MNNLIILLIGVFIFLLISFVLNGHDFLSPSFIVCLMFFISSIFALYSFKAWNVSEDSITIEGTFIILSGIMIFLITELTIRGLIVYQKNYEEVISLKEPIYPSKAKIQLMIGMCLVSTVLYSFFLYKYMQSNGYSGGFNMSQIALAHHDLSFQDEREGNIPRIVRIMKMAEIAAMFIGIYIFINNTVLCKEKVKKNLFFFVPALLYVPIALLSSSRSIYIQVAGSTILISYVMLSRRNNWKKRMKNNIKIIRVAVIIFTLALALFYIASASGLIGRQTERTFFDYISVYIGAPIINFNLFLKNPPSLESEYFGQETFAGLNSILFKFGIQKYRYTAQLERRWINGINAGNVYTFFRRPYRDFGLSGMYVIVIITAAFFSYIYYKKIYRKPQSYKADKTLILYSYFFYVIYLFPILNQWCNLISFSQIYFLISFSIVYAYLLGKLKFTKRGIRINKRNFFNRYK